MSELKLGFEMKKIRLSLGDILPVRQIGGQQRIDRYQTIVKSIKEVGMVEPLMVHPQKGASGRYLLVDGHLRLHALRELGETEADCIIANDDESYTYNAVVFGRVFAGGYHWVGACSCRFCHTIVTCTNLLGTVWWRRGRSTSGRSSRSAKLEIAPAVSSAFASAPGRGGQGSNRRGPALPGSGGRLFLSFALWPVQSRVAIHARALSCQWSPEQDARGLLPPHGHDFLFGRAACF